MKTNTLPGGPALFAVFAKICLTTQYGIRDLVAGSQKIGFAL